MKMNVRVEELGRGGDKLTAQVIARVTASDYARMCAVAQENNLRLSDYVRIATRRYTDDLVATGGAQNV